MNSKHRGSEEGQGFGINPNVGEEGEGQVVREAMCLWVIPVYLGHFLLVMPCLVVKVNGKSL